MTRLDHMSLADLTVDDGARPLMPKLPQATDADREKGRQLALIHQHYLHDMGRIAAVLRRIKAGDAPPEDLRDIVLSSEMTQNFKAFGSLCGQECQILTMHHNIEETSMFPGLELPEHEGLRAVIARLRQEHRVVHELLVRLERAATMLMQMPKEENFKEAAVIFSQLERVVRSHFRYEETELEEAIGVYLDAI
ncbi:MAG: hemerythrin domain-containing protein [Pseudomonadota bacterium]